MHRKNLLAATLAILMAGSSALVMGQDAPPPAAGAMQGKRMMGPAAQHGASKGPGMDDRGMWQRGGRDAHGGVVSYLRGLERLYMMSGRSKDMAAVYNDVLAKSQDPRIRDYAYQHLARLQARPSNVDQAIATMRKGLDESLAREATMRAEREKMRSVWKQRHDNAAKPSAAQ